MVYAIIFVLVILGLTVHEYYYGPLGTRRRSAPCKHGVTGKCAACLEETERLARQQELERKWEVLRKAEVRRLSQLRLKSASAYADMGSRDFEDSIAKLFRALGFRVVQTPYVGDGGKDAIAWKDNKKYVIECKRYGSCSATGRRDLQILLAAKHDENADEAIFISTGRLTAPAVAYAIQNQIEYYDALSLPDLVNRAYGRAKAYAVAHTICLECGAECSVRLKKQGPSTGTHLATIQGVKHKHMVQTSIDLTQLRYPDLDLDAPWCKQHHVPMRRVNGYRGDFWGCPKYPNCRNTGGPAAKLPEKTEAERMTGRDEFSSGDFSQEGS